MAVPDSGGKNVSLPNASTVGLVNFGSAAVVSGQLVSSNVASHTTSQPECEGIGHLADDVVPYADGVVVGKCTRCGARMQFKVPAGGDQRLEAERLVAYFLSESLAVDRDPDLHDRIQLMISKLRLDVSSLNAALATLQMIDDGLSRGRR